ncbi:GRB2-associated-binding protein 3 isoform 1-T1 [Polymixia lowei]
MSTGDVVCKGWLIKSPPEKKLKIFTWRKRWFVLRSGRMSGNPDVLEYYQSKSSKKPIRTIDLKECEVQMQIGQLLLKREFHEKHPFAVKTLTRIFYLVAKTEEEMKSWIKGISQICQFEPLENAESSEEGLSQSRTSLQPSLVIPSPASHDRESTLSELESSHPPVYLLLSQCETGASPCISRWDSFSNSESSLEHKSADESVEDIIPSPLRTNFSPSSFLYSSKCPLTHRRMSTPPSSAPCTPMVYDRPRRLTSSFSSHRHFASNIFQFEKLYSPATADRQPPPPLPPKPNHLSEQLSDERTLGAWQQLSGQDVIPRTISFSSPDHFRKGDAETSSVRNKRLSLNLPCLNSTQVPNDQEDSYIPMASPPGSATVDVTDGYIPMSPITSNSLRSNCNAESPMTLSTVMCLSGDLVPPPVNRHLKPRRRARPPPLDLRGLSTIREYPTHLHLNSSMIEPRTHENGENNGDEDTSCAANEPMQQFFLSSDGTMQSWARRSNLDYLSLDFNSASPSPVQKKPFLVDEHRVDYVKVDEKKTQALQNTRMEWTDVRQSKT